MRSMFQQVRSQWNPLFLFDGHLNEYLWKCFMHIAFSNPILFTQAKSYPVPIIKVFYNINKGSAVVWWVQCGGGARGKMESPSACLSSNICQKARYSLFGISQGSSSIAYKCFADFMTTAFLFDKYYSGAKSF